MQYHDIRLLVSAAGKEQWPNTDLPEVIFAGRSNCGKSSLINALVNRSSIAYSGKTPGKTRLLNFFEVDHRLIFTDAPGYGYAAGIKQSAVSFSKLLDPYFQTRSQLKGMILVLDCRRMPNSDDMTMIEYARSVHLPVIAALTKTDKVSRSQLNQNRAKILAQLNIQERSCTCVSSLKKENLDSLWNQINEMIHA